jgi:tRNA pseudouridine65 synthase
LFYPTVYQDEHLVVVHKPAGMLVHRGMGASADEPFLLQLVRDRVGQYVYPAHRLDRPTCGLVVFSLSPEVARLVSESWQRGEVHKSYQAIVRGWMPTPTGECHEALDSPDNGALQEAHTEWRERQRWEVPIPSGPYLQSRLSLLELTPHTGRWHQLRRHMVRCKHPIVGDTTHGDRHINHALQTHLGWWRLLLWAHRLEFVHPVTGEKMTLQEPPEWGLGPFCDALDALTVPGKT